MRICLDVRFKIDSGSSSYIRNVIPEILRLDSQNQYSLVKYPHQSFSFDQHVSDILLSPVSDAGHLLWNLFVLPMHLRARRVDIFHSMKFPGPWWIPAKSVMTAHSISRPYKGEFPMSRKARLFYLLYADPLFRRADKIIAVSRFVAEFLTERLHVPRNNVVVVPHGLDPSFRVLNKEDTDVVRRKYSLTRDYLLCIGNITPVKNHVTAMKAYSRIAADFPLDLVIAGGTGNLAADKVRRLIQMERLEDRVKLLGFVHKEELVPLINGARLLVFPSLTEGWPVTVMEAFGCGLPMVASKRGGLWEIGQDVSLFVEDPMDNEGFASRIREYLTSPTLEMELRKKVFERSTQFQWTKAAQEHIAAYKSLSEGSVKV